MSINTKTINWNGAVENDKLDLLIFILHIKLGKYCMMPDFISNLTIYFCYNKDYIRFCCD